MLKSFELQDKKAKEIIVVSNADPPSPRLFATFTPVPGPVQIQFLSSLAVSNVHIIAMMATRRE